MYQHEVARSFSFPHGQDPLTYVSSVSESILSPISMSLTCDLGPFPEFPSPLWNFPISLLYKGTRLSCTQLVSLPDTLPFFFVSTHRYTFLLVQIMFSPSLTLFSSWYLFVPHLSYPLISCVNLWHERCLVEVFLLPVSHLYN